MYKPNNIKQTMSSKCTCHRRQILSLTETNIQILYVRKTNKLCNNLPKMS